MRSLVLAVLFSIFTYTNALATTYYASPSGGGAASCVDNSTNVCSIQRAVTVAAGGTNTIEMANGTYSATTSLIFNATNTGANLTIQKAAGATPVLGSTGSTYVVDIQNTMVSGSITFDGITITDADTDYGIHNKAPEVNVTFKNGAMNLTDPSSGTGFYYELDSANRISLETGEDTTTNLRTGATTNTKIAQKIVVGGSNITVNRAAFKLRKRCGNKGTNCDEYVSGESWNYRTADTLTVTIETDSAGAPSGTPVTNGTSTTVLASDVFWRNSSGEWQSFTFSSNVTLTASTTYWVVITGNYTASSTNYIEVETDTGDGYASGDSATYDGTTWTGASAGTDLLFAIDRAETRNLTVTGNTITTRGVCFSTSWADTITIDSNTLTSTASGIYDANPNNQWTVSDLKYKKIAFTNNIVSSTTNGTKMIGLGVANFNKTYTDVVIVKGNSGIVSMIMQPIVMVKKLYIVNNNLEVQYNGNCPLQLGKETDGIDPPEYNYEPFYQILIEGNTFHYTASVHNHLILLAIGAENGILRNNKIYATDSGSGGRAWGIVVKANGWLIENNSVFGSSPAVAVYGTNHTRVIGNTLESFGSGGDGTVLVRTHQDRIYGPRYYGISNFNYIKDNIIVSDDAFPALDYGTSSTDATDPMRNSNYWSNIIDNNIYYAKTNSTYVRLANPSNTANLISSDGVSTLRADWASNTYIDQSSSLSIYNDLGNSIFTNPNLNDVANGNFTTSNTYVLNKGTQAGTNIGADQESGLQSGGPFGSAQFGSGF